jgi:hypothetical protein
VAASTRRRRHAALRSSYRWLVREELVDINPMERVDAVSVPTRLPSSTGRYAFPEDQLPAGTLRALRDPWRRKSPISESVQFRSTATRIRTWERSAVALCNTPISLCRM